MPIIRVETLIEVPVARCFDLARDIDLHCRTAARTRERAVAGVTTGLIGLGDSVTFEGVHFGVRQRLSARIIEFEPPQRFVDEMTQGAFQSFTHCHEFWPYPMDAVVATATCTLMCDTLKWVAPLGWLGCIADKLFLERHLRAFLLERNANLKGYAEEGKQGDRGDSRTLSVSDELES